MKVIAIQRDERFSPNSVKNDRLILEMVSRSFNGTIFPEKELTPESIRDCELILNMGRLPETLNILKDKSLKNALILNPGKGVEHCKRSHLQQLMQQYEIPMPPQKGSHGFWIKRGNAAAQTREDVKYCADDNELKNAKKRFADRGIKDIIVQAHIEGDLIKFYGVEGSDFFKIYYPGDDGITKFGDEMKNGKPKHTDFNRQQLRDKSELLSKLTGVPIYGGDAIINNHGEFFIIDFNDWPSFSRCREVAATAIVNYIKRKQ